MIFEGLFPEGLPAPPPKRKTTTRHITFPLLSGFQNWKGETRNGYIIASSFGFFGPLPIGNWFPAGSLKNG